MSASDAAAELRRLLGEELVSDDPADLAVHSRDWSPVALLEQRSGTERIPPACVVRPEKLAHVVTLLEWAHDTATPVVPYGAGSSVVRGIQPDGAVVVDMGAMWFLRDVDTRSRLVEAEAGVSGPQLKEALAAQGFLLGHEPQSHDISTVGGWVATRAVGQLSSRYGGIEDVVAGVEAVLPGGKVVRTTVVPRRSVGPDVSSLMMGSEGTLGIITSVTLKVSSLDAERVDVCLRFEHMTDGVKAARAIVQADLRPTVVRLYDADDASLFLRHHPNEPSGPLMIMSFEGFAAEGRAARARELADGAPGNDGLVNHWWEHRNDAVDEFRKVMAGEGLLGPHGVVDTIEVSASWTALRDLYHSLKSGLGEQADLVGCHVSHVYPDGACLYFTIASVTDSDDAARSKLETWWKLAMEATLANGGSISHHHGIGRTKAPWLKEELGGWFDVLRAVKSSIDPKGIMNPGALGL